MKNQVIENGNYDSKKHSMKYNCDAFGDKIKPPIGFRLLIENEPIQKGDWHFDIYAGWVQGHGDRKNGSRLHCEGRWRGWARKI